ncbi:PhnE/PtxC family ABC transporter permease [Niallia endozanthoxylica]|uniref:ABC transporter permease subunit n=1 Tax=Niallia endozanthoxylica TaxID=2036016 RepID=A0A5J5HU41_9BACI|nr:ABC transporter permease subunit [Niallia endozanthoxylica]KAA9025691.1 ABC transporter permease subunit [Niallia endozanthoxylica]
MMNLKYTLQLQRKNILSFFLAAIFIWSLFAVKWSEDLVHSGGLATIQQVALALFNPNLSPTIIQLALESTWITLAYAVCGMTLAIVIAFFFGIFASGIMFDHTGPKLVFKWVFRGILGFLRAIHELVWALIFVAMFGLSPLSAILALGIPYGGILGRILADMLNDIPEEPIQALRASGASKLQCLLYGYFPLVRANIISYTMYRFECAIRSSAIMSFVGLGGLGFQIQLSLNDLKYDEVWTFLFFLIGIVVLVDSWSVHVRKGIHEAKKGFTFVSFSFFFTILLLISSWWFIFSYEQASLKDLFSEKNAFYAQKFFAGLFGIGAENTPAFLQLEAWKEALKLTYETLRMSVLAIGISTIAMFLTVIPAARNIADGSLTLIRKWYAWLLFGFIRILYIFSRAIPELVWAMIIIFILKPGILPGAIALALHNFGILGKLCAEVIEDLDERPVRNLASCGASKSQMLLYGVLPAVMPKFLMYILYRWEVIMRTTIVVGFVGAGGLGQQFKMSLSFFHYTDVSLLLLCYCILVLIADLLSEAARKAAK